MLHKMCMAGFNFHKIREVKQNMKGFNVKKLVAIGIGAALLGSAVAPIVSASNVQKDDIYNASGSPKVNIVIGSQAALSDAVWAGNLAAKIAEKAATTGRVSVSATGEGGESASELDLSDLTVDVTVGGTVSFGAGTKKYSVLLASGTSSAEVRAALDDTDDTNALTDAQLPHLYNDNVTQKVLNGDLTSTTRTNINVKELIGIGVDAKFDTGSSVKDLVAKIDTGDFSYQVTFGAAATGIDLGSTSFTDGTNDAVKLIFFGEEYELSEATLSGTKYVKLVKSSAREAYNEGETIEGLVGDNLLDGEDLTVKVVQIIQTGPASGTYQATFELYDSESNLVDTRTVSTTENLRDVFKDDGQDEALASNLYIDTIAIGSTTGIGYVEVTKGTDTVELYSGSIYPYDSSHTSSSPYKATITAGTSDANSLYSLKIANSAEVWDSEDGGTFDLGPLYPARTGQSLQDNEGNTASFLETLPEGTQGKGFATVEFMGFEGDEEKTTVEFGKSAVAGTGGIKFVDEDGDTREIPYYIQVNDSNSGEIFQFEDKDFWAEARYATAAGGDGKAGTYDYNVSVTTGDIVNGRIWTISGGDANVSLAVAAVGAMGDPIDADGALGYSVWDLNVISVDGVNYKIQDANTGAAAATMIVSVDLAFELKQGTDNTGTEFFNASGSTSTDNLLLLTHASTFDSNADGLGVKLYGSDSARYVEYSAQYNSTNGNEKLWLLLDAQAFGNGGTDNTIQNAHAVSFLGTSVPTTSTYTEVEGIRATQGTEFEGVSATSGAFSYYVPKSTDFNNDSANSASEAYFVAEFQVNSAVDSSDFNVYIDTADATGIGPFPSTNLSAFADDVEYLGTPAWTLQGGSQSTYLSAGYTDAATKASLIDNGATIKIRMPQLAEKVDIIVYGTEVERDVSGGETLTLGEGETGTTDAGAKITIEAVNGGSCGVAGGDGDIICSANPETYGMPAAVRNPLVYLDTEAPAGSNIIIGGQLVNALASGLADRLTAPGQVIAEVDASSGDIYAAGYTAGDTGSAVQELIDDIDAMELA